MTPHNSPGGPSGGDLYAVLGVAPTATGEQIRRAYRRRALALHPDRNPDPGATALFRAVAEAYAVLADPARRADYDTDRFPPTPDTTNGTAAAAPTATPPPADEPTVWSVNYAEDYVAVSEPVAHADYAPTSGYAPPPPPSVHPPAPPPTPLPRGWPTGRIDHHCLLGRVLLGVWRLAPLPPGRIATAAVVTATVAAAALAVVSHVQMPVESTVIGMLAALALACWAVRVVTVAALHARTRRVVKRTR